MPAKSKFEIFKKSAKPIAFSANLCYNSNDAEVRKESIFTLMHELSHQLGAPDHYCYGPSTTSEGCANPNCDTCYMGRDAERPCMMTYRYDIEATDEDVLYCSSCLQIIAAHLTDHHQ